MNLSRGRATAQRPIWFRAELFLKARYGAYVLPAEAATPMQFKLPVFHQFLKRANFQVPISIEHAR